MALLPHDTLRGTRIALSVSESPDLGRLGLLKGHLYLAVGEIARTVLTLGGRMQYGGHLQPGGFTSFLLGELGRYGRGSNPLDVVLAWPVHRAMTLAALRDANDALGVLGSLRLLNEAGTEISAGDGRGEEPAAVDRAAVPAALAAMRRFLVAKAQAFLLLGGKRSGYQGTMPGIVEEAHLAIAAGRAVFLAGGFGGATLDIIRAVKPDAAEWLPPPLDIDPGCRRGIDMISSLVAERGWDALTNGLDAAENVRLAATHRPSEVATLVSLGLGRMAASGSFAP